VSIALVEDGRPVAGVVHAPAMGDTFVATLGGGAYLNGARIRVSRRAGFDELTTLAATVPTAAELHARDFPLRRSRACRRWRCASSASPAAASTPGSPARTRMIGILRRPI
jgi:fructose-1,6-bisphosphatase/inositol monophosphatase family enzyme